MSPSSETPRDNETPRPLPLPGALDRVPRLLPRAAELCVRLVWGGGLPGEAVAAPAARRAPPPAVSVNMTARLLYLFFVLTSMEVVIGFLAYFVLPKFEV